MAENNEAIRKNPTSIDEGAKEEDDYGCVKKSNKDLHASLHELDTSLECPICYDYFRIPVSLSHCQHSFCSECIRSSFKTQMKLVTKNQRQECPVCRAPASCDANSTGNKIVPNLLLGRIVKNFLDIKPLLIQQLTSSVDITTVSTVIQREQPLSSTTTIESSTTVASAAATQKSLLQRRGPTRYYGLKRKQLQALCQSEGLSTLGTDEELRQRHADFCLLVNAECDSEFPRTEDELRLELTKRENNKKLAATSDRKLRSTITGPIENLKLARKLAGEEPSAHVPVKSGDPNFDKKLVDGFQKLITEASSAKKRPKRKHEEDTRIIDHLDNQDNDNAANHGNLLNYYTESCCEEQPHETMKSDGTDGTSSASVKRLPSSISTADENKTMDSSTEGFLPSCSDSHDTMKENVFHELEMLQIQYMNNEFPNMICTTPSLSTEKKVSNSSTQHQFMSSTAADQKKNPLFSPAAERSIIGPWQCPVCTYFNTNRNWLKALCEMCEQGQRVLAPK